MNAPVKISAATATIDKLRPGQEYPAGNINARQHYTDAEIDELGASLMPDQDGQLRPMLVATHKSKPGVYYVFGGGRRRLAYDRLIAAGKLPKDYAIEIQNFGQIEPEKALSLSLADNQAVPMHPADQAVTFAKLAKDRAPEDIARDRGMTLKAVKQAIALGTALAPEVIAAWRAGKLTKELVEVFTVAADFESQVKALNDGLANGYLLKTNEVRRSLMRNKEPEMKRLLGFVGVAEYRAAGGEVAEDFFGAGGNVKDMKLLKRLAKAKMERIVADLEAEGWSWVEPRMAENFMHHGYGEMRVKPGYTSIEKKRLDEIKPALKAEEKKEWRDTDHDLIERLEDEQEAIEMGAAFRSFTDKQKAQAGVIVTVTKTGAVSYLGGLTRKAETKKAARKGDAAQPETPEPPKIPDINREAEEMIEGCQHQALADLVAAKPKEAFALFLASVATGGGYNDPVNWQDIDSHFDGVTTARSFETAFDQLRKTPADKLLAKFATAVAEVTDVAGYFSENKSAAAIVTLVGEKNLQAGLAKLFDAKIYVAGASKQHLLGVIAETQGADERKEVEDWNQGSLAEHALKGIKATSWLPPQLRTRAYTGPSAKKTAKPKKKAR